MAMQVPSDLLPVVEQLHKIDALAIDNGVSRHFLEIEKAPDCSELRINGNPQGLIHLARAVLDVAITGLEGAHHHFDSSGIVDRTDLPVVVRLKAADWDT
jgi:hypothetical protein